MQQLNRAFVTAAAHVELFVRDGWLIHLALMSDVKGHFEDLHALIIDILEAAVPEHLLTEVRNYSYLPLLADFLAAAHSSLIQQIVSLQTFAGVFCCCWLS